MDFLVRVHTPFNPKKLKTYEAVGIRVVTGYYNHIARICNYKGQCVVLEAIGPEGVIITPLIEWLIKRRGQVLHYSAAKTIVSDTQIEQYLNKDYDYASALWCLAVYKTTGQWIGRRHTADRKIYCFELQAILEGEEYWYRCLT